MFFTLNPCSHRNVWCVISDHLLSAVSFISKQNFNRTKAASKLNTAANFPTPVNLIDFAFKHVASEPQNRKGGPTRRANKEHNIEELSLRDQSMNGKIVAWRKCEVENFVLVQVTNLLLPQKGIVCFILFTDIHLFLISSFGWIAFITLHERILIGCFVRIKSENCSCT